MKALRTVPLERIREEIAEDLNMLEAVLVKHLKEQNGKEPEIFTLGRIFGTS